MDGHLYERADWVCDQCCPSARHDGSDPLSALCRFLERYREKVIFERIDDHLLDDIGVDVESVQRIRLRERTVRHLSLIACGGHI